VSISLSIYNKNYYKKSRETSINLESNHGLLRFLEISKKSNYVIEFGCGEGTKLSRMNNGHNKLFGIDYSENAIKIAKKRYHNVNFSKQNIEKTNFKYNKFDFTYSSFVMEHTENPEKILKEMIRVTKKGGKIGIIYRSPCSKENFIKRFFRIIIRDLLIFKKDTKKIIWDKVTPIVTENKYLPDWDTTIEPSLLTFLHYLKGNNNVKVLEKSSLWELKNTTKPKKNFLYAPTLIIINIFYILGINKVYPFKYYGPQLFIILEKTK